MDRKFLLKILFLFLTQNAAAVALPGDNSQSTAAPTGLAQSGIYFSNQEIPLIIPREYGTKGNMAEYDTLIPFQIPKDVPFAVQVEPDRLVVSVLVPKSMQGIEPDRFVFGPHDLDEAGLQFLMPGDEQVLNANFTADLETKVAGHCKTYVEQALGFHAGGLCASSLNAGNLAPAGFHPAPCSDAILQVWGGGPRGCGHVAMKRGGVWTSIDYVGNPGRGFYSKGCFSRGGWGFQSYQTSRSYGRHPKYRKYRKYRRRRR